MTTAKETKWRPEHFPVGTIATIGCVERVNGELQHVHNGHGADVTVRCVIQNGVDSWVIMTGEHNESLDIERGYNLAHVTNIVKRGDGQVKFEDRWSDKPMINLKESISNGLLNKNRFYFYEYGSRELFNYLVSQITSIRHAYVTPGFNVFIRSQSFIRLEVNGFVNLYSVDKKKVKRFIRQNINRWLTPMSVIRAADKISKMEEAAQYYADLERDFERDYLEAGAEENADSDELPVVIPDDHIAKLVG